MLLSGSKNRPDNWKDAVRRYRSWLLAFGDGPEGWKAFVKANFMQPFLRGWNGEANSILPFGDMEQESWQPKPLWTADSGLPGFIMPEGAQISEYFTNAAKAIRARSGLIAEALAAAEDRRSI